MRDLDRHRESGFRRRRIPEIAFKIGNPRRGDERGIDIGLGQVLAGAEIGTHRALPVGRDQYEAATARRTVFRRQGGKGHVRGANVVREDRAERIRLQLADEGRAAPELRGADDRIGGRAAGDDRRLTHGAVKPFGRGFVDEPHRAFVQPVRDQEIVVARRDDVDDRVAEADNVVKAGVHAPQSPSNSAVER